MSDFDDVRRIALALPATEERTQWGNACWRVGGRNFVWDRPLRKTDLRELGDGAPAGDILGARVESLVAKEALIADPSQAYFATSHFDGSPIVLARLAVVPVDELEELIVEAWLLRAPPKLARAYEAEHLPEAS